MALRVRSGGWENALIEMEMPILGPTVELDEAILSLYVASRSSENVATCRLYELLRAWNEDEATWNVAALGAPWSNPGASAIGGDRSDVELGNWALDQAGIWLSWNVTDLVTDWLANPGNNHGLVIIGEGAGGVEYRFASSEYEWNEFRPKLTLHVHGGLPGIPTSTPTTTPSATNTPSPTITHTATSTPTSTPSCTSSPTPTPSATSSGDLILSGKVYDASVGTSAGISGALVDIALPCISRNFQAYTNMVGHYDLLVPAIYATACPDAQIEVSADEYQSFFATFPMSFVVSNPEINVGLVPAGTGSPTPTAEHIVALLPVVMKSSP